MANEKLRDYAKEHYVKMWQIADAVGIAESTLCRRLRHQLSDADAAIYIDAIEKIARARDQPTDGGDTMR